MIRLGLFTIRISSGGCSSVGRASASQAEGREFEPRHPLQINLKISLKRTEKRVMGKCEVLHRKTHGFSLVEMAVVLGLLAGAGVFIGNMLVQGTKGQKKVSANLDFNIKMAEVFNVLQNSSYCNSATNGVFRQASGATLNPAKLTNENTPATNDVNWIGYQVGSGGTAQNIKVLQEGDVLENTYTISEITFQRLKDTAGNVVAAVNNAGKSTHQVELIITATPTSGSGFPISKSFKTTLITDTPSTSPTNDVVGCFSSYLGFRLECPSDFILIGSPGTAEAYCISRNKHRKTTYGEATRLCAQTGSHLCSPNEWSGACWTGAVAELAPLLSLGLSNLPGNDSTNFTYREWVADLLEGSSPPTLTPSGFAAVMGFNYTVSGTQTSNCHYPFKQLLIEDVGYYASYRCCFR